MKSEFKREESDLTNTKSEPIEPIESTNEPAKPEVLKDTNLYIREGVFPFRDDRRFILVGQSAAGKDWVLGRLMEEYGYGKLVSCTTRPRRPHEVEGVDYYFKEKPPTMATPHAAHRTYTTVENGEEATWHYWLTPEEVARDTYIGILDYEGAKELIEWSYEFVGKRPTIVYVWASAETLRRRAEGRPGYEKEEFDRRLEIDLAWEEEAIRMADIVINNDKENKDETEINE